MIIRKNLPFFNVVASGVASLELEKGMTYNRIMLKLGGTAFTKAMITRIVCKLNGKPFYDITGARLDLINKYRGLGDNVAYLMIDFGEPLAKTKGGMYAGRIPTASGISSFTVEVTIAGATAPTLESWSYLTEPEPFTKETRIHSIMHHPKSFSAGGKFPITLPHGMEVDHYIKRVHFFHANMTTLEVKKNGLLIFEELADADNDFVQSEVKKVPQAGLYVYDPTVNNDLARVLNTGDASTLQFNTTVSAADTVDVYPEYLAKLANL